jgi:hypothetical protein
MTFLKIANQDFQPVHGMVVKQYKRQFGWWLLTVIFFFDISGFERQITNILSSEDRMNDHPRWRYVWSLSQSSGISPNRKHVQWNALLVVGAGHFSKTFYLMLSTRKKRRARLYFAERNEWGGVLEFNKEISHIVYTYQSGFENFQPSTFMRQTILLRLSGLLIKPWRHFKSP